MSPSIAEIARWRRPERMSREERLREEENMRKASIERRDRDIRAIDYHLRRGMSRKSLIVIYGADLVDAVIAMDPILA